MKTVKKIFGMKEVTLIIVLAVFVVLFYVLQPNYLSSSNIIGIFNSAFTMGTLAVGRLGVATQSIGIAQGAIDEAVKFITERKQFGQYLSEFQALRFMVAEMETKLNAARLLCY